MGKNTGFLEYERATGPDRDIKERIRDYREVHQMYQSEEAAKTQGARCMDCGVPFCHALSDKYHSLLRTEVDAKL